MTAALTLFRGTGQRTQFEQAVNDFSSKMQNTIKAISNEQFPQTDQYTCAAGPQLTAGGTQGQSTNQDCVYLGKIFHVAKDQNFLKIYTVIGNRKCDNHLPSTCPNGQIATSFIDTDPKVANLALAGGDLNNGVLTETYTLPSGGTKLVWANANCSNSDGTCAEVDVTGFYNGIGTSSAGAAQGGALNLLTRAYALNGSGLTPVALATCLTNDTVVGVCASDLKNWQLCFSDSNSQNLRALVTLTVTSNSSSSIVKLKGC